MVSDADEYTDKGKGHKDANIRSNIMLNMLYEAIKSLAENIWGALEAVSTAMVFIYLPRQNLYFCLKWLKIKDFGE